MTLHPALTPLTTLTLVVIALTRLQALPPQTETPVKVGGNVKAPTKTKNVLPIKPADAPDDGKLRVVFLQLTISKTGKVIDAKPVFATESKVPVASLTPKSLTDAAVAAAKQWEFAPPLVDGRPHAVLYSVAFDFSCAFTGCGRKP
jgi:hypothetical protein